LTPFADSKHSRQHDFDIVFKKIM